jgi:hypothetical protein
MVLWAKPWLWDIKHCWYNYPHHVIDRDVWWYFMVELSFYWALCISQFFDVRRKDFWEMFLHHVTTIALMAFSWTCNFTRVGTLVLVIHDCADIFLEVLNWLFLETRLKILPVQSLHTSHIQNIAKMNPMGHPMLLVFCIWLLNY